MVPVIKRTQNSIALRTSDICLLLFIAQCNGARYNSYLGCPKGHISLLIYRVFGVEKGPERSSKPSPDTDFDAFLEGFWLYLTGFLTLFDRKPTLLLRENPHQRGLLDPSAGGSEPPQKHEKMPFLMIFL